VTVVHHDTFVNGKHRYVEPKENYFLSKEARSGRPNITPDKNMARPVVREVAEIKKPPQTVRQIQVKELKAKRPLVKEKEASVLRPGASQKEMLLKRVERKEVEQPKDIKPSEPRKESTPTNRTHLTETGRLVKTTSPEGKAQQSSLFQQQGQVTAGNAKKNTESNMNNNTEKREITQRTQKDVEKPQVYQAEQKRTEEPRENTPLKREVQKSQETRPTRKEGKAKEVVLTERNFEKNRASNGAEREVDKNKTFATPAVGAKTAPSLTQYGRETGGAMQTKKGTQETQKTRISAKGTGKPLL
jgi:hypothetical protein